jgi:glycosyltransferase involved in cell wall biosynthesis
VAHRSLQIMPKVTALIHAHNDATRLGRALESLRPCDDVLVIQHGSDHDTEKVAREHGARIKTAVPGVADGTYLTDAKHDWILCVLPSEALSEALEASLLEWKRREHDALGFAVAIREQTGNGWRDQPAERRLVNRNKLNWTTELPPNDPAAERLEGELLRFQSP